MAAAAASSSCLQCSLLCHRRSFHVPLSFYPGAPFLSRIRSRCFTSSLPFHFSSLSIHGGLSAFVLRQPLTVCLSGVRQETATEDERESIDAIGGEKPPHDGSGGDGDGGGNDAMGRLSSVVILACWAAFLGYCTLYSPDQTPMTDRYFLEKLLQLKGDDGFQMNQVLVCLWYVMGIWPAIYTMLLIPTGRSGKGGIPIWPFTSLSFFAGAFALLPYFALWQPPSPKFSEEEIDAWPLKILDSKILAGSIAFAGVILLGTAAFAGSESWVEFIKYFKSSRFIHVMSLDFLALSSLAPFWVINDIEVRKRSKESSWLQYLAFIPVVGPALYLVLRPSLRDCVNEYTLR